MDTPLTPTEELIVDNLVARHRLGEKIWTFHRNSTTTRALAELDARGLVSFRSGVVEDTWLAHLTEKGRAEYMDPEYTPPHAKQKPSTTVTFCPVSSGPTKATIDAEGFCTEHGWNCDDFRLSLLGKK